MPPPVTERVDAGLPLRTVVVDDHRWLERFAALGRLAGPLCLLSAVYGLAMRLRNAAYDRGCLPSRRLGVPVISVGNLVAGGVGKTPIVRFLAQTLNHRGLAPSEITVITRGYGNRLTQSLYRLSGQESAALVGDEAFLLKKWLPLADILISPDRYAAHSLIRRGCALCILDDGFQHRALVRELDIVVASEEGPAALLPAGPGREPAASLHRAQVLWIHSRYGRPTEGQGLPEWARDFRGIVVRSHYRPGRFRPLNAPALQELTGEGRGGDSGLPSAMQVYADEPNPATRQSESRWWVVVGIANGERILEQLSHIRMIIMGISYFPDHHSFRSGDIAHVERLARRAGASRILTTEKDGARLAPLVQELGLEWHCLEVEVVLTEGAEVLSSLLTALLSGNVGKLNAEEMHTNIIT